MAMYDHFRSELALPRGEGRVCELIELSRSSDLRTPSPIHRATLVGAQFQTKSFDSAFLDEYQLRADGTLWRNVYELRTERNERSPLGFYLRRDNPRWEPHAFTGEVRFYTSSGTPRGAENDGASAEQAGWIEFSAYFLKGKLRELHCVHAQGFFAKEGEVKPSVGLPAKV